MNERLARTEPLLQIRNKSTLSDYGVTEQDSLEEQEGILEKINRIGGKADQTTWNLKHKVKDGYASDFGVNAHVCLFNLRALCVLCV